MFAIQAAIPGRFLPIYGRGPTLLRALASLEQSLASNGCQNFSDLIENRDVEMSELVDAMDHNQTYSPMKEGEDEPFIEICRCNPSNTHPMCYIDELFYLQTMTQSYKNDLVRLVREGTIPSTVGSFYQLVDLVDTNVLGQADDYISQIERDLSISGINSSEELHSKGMEVFISLFNKMVNEIDTWIKHGHLIHTADFAVREERTLAPRAGGRIISLQEGT